MSDQARAIVSEFGQQDGVGEKVMKLLEERREREDNWAYDYWLRDMYLNVRLPLPVNSNPAMVLPRRKFSGHTQMLCYTARSGHPLVVTVTDCFCLVWNKGGCENSHV